MLFQFVCIFVSVISLELFEISLEHLRYHYEIFTGGRCHQKLGRVQKWSCILM